VYGLATISDAGSLAHSALLGRSISGLRADGAAHVAGLLAR
jgi:hypothetical protein